MDDEEAIAEAEKAKKKAEAEEALEKAQRLKEQADRILASLEPAVKPKKGH